MALNRFKKVNFADKMLTKFQSNLEQYLNQFKLVPFLSGKVIEPTVSSTASQVNHGLGRTPQGFIQLHADSSGILYSTASDNDTITLVVSGATTTFKLWVY